MHDRSEQDLYSDFARLHRSNVHDWCSLLLRCELRGARARVFTGEGRNLFRCDHGDHGHRGYVVWWVAARSSAPQIHPPQNDLRTPTTDLHSSCPAVDDDVDDCRSSLCFARVLIREPSGVFQHVCARRVFYVFLFVPSQQCGDLGGAVSTVAVGGGRLHCVHSFAG